MRGDRLVLLLITLTVLGAGAAFGWAAMVDVSQQFHGVDEGPAALGAPVPWQLNFQLPFSPVHEGLYAFHNYLLVMNIAISALVIILILYAAWRFRASRNPVPSRITHNTKLEVIWTVLPVLVLFSVAIPSFRMNVAARTVPPSELTVKVTGNQWYWDYEYPDHGIAFPSVIVPEEQLQPQQRRFRLLETDNKLVLPTETNIQFLITSNDVIHSWAVPAFGVKQDAIPGKMTQTWTRIEKPGLYYGQCSVLCGSNHAYMPVAIRAVSREEFAAWVATQGRTVTTPAVQPPSPSLPAPATEVATQ